MNGENLKSRFSAWPCAFLLLTLLPTDSRGLERETALAEVGVIHNRSGEVRVLLAPAAIDGLEDELITSAFLELPLPGLAPEEDIEIALHAVATPWRGRAYSWQSPWQRPGGDVEEAYSHVVTLPKGEPANELRLDVTEIVQDMVDGELGKNGFLIAPAAWRGEGFRVPELGVLGPLATGKLVITYRKLSALGVRRIDR
jgi:hypothetical protein